MKRREFIGLIAGAVALPFPTRAQKSSQMRHVGVLIPYPESDAESQVQLSAFSEKLQQLGWTEGQNLQVSVFWTGGDFGRLQSKAKELAALNPDAIFVRSTAATRALQRETKRIPIVCCIRSCRGWLCKQYGEARWQHYRLHQCRGFAGRKVARGVNGALAKYRQRCSYLRSKDRRRGW